MVEELLFLSCDLLDCQFASDLIYYKNKEMSMKNYLIYELTNPFLYALKLLWTEATLTSLVDCSLEPF